MHFFDTSTTSPDLPAHGHFGRAWALFLVMGVWSSAAMGQETDFSPFARFGLGTSQGTLTPALASMGGVTSVSTGHMSVNAEQPALPQALCTTPSKDPSTFKAYALRKEIVPHRRPPVGPGVLDS